MQVGHSFSFTYEKVNTSELASKLNKPTGGGLVVFEGRVRNYNKNKNVSMLEYEGESNLAEIEFLNIIKEASNNWKILDCLCVHRLGKVRVSETSLWIGVLSEHRKDAFLACSYIVSELKKRLPIWKREIYEDGSFNWISENS